MYNDKGSKNINKGQNDLNKKFINESWAKDFDDIVSFYKTNLDNGLSDYDIRKRMSVYGKNILKEKKKKKWFTIFVK